MEAFEIKVEHNFVERRFDILPNLSKDGMFIEHSIFEDGELIATLIMNDEMEWEDSSAILNDGTLIELIGSGIDNHYL